jgi:DNA-binding CsgD family transcriptional regulator
MAESDQPNLTAREIEVLDLMRLGLTNAQIAQRLGISRDAVRYHVKELHSRLQTGSSRHWLRTFKLRGLLFGGILRFSEPVLYASLVAGTIGIGAVTYGTWSGGALAVAGHVGGVSPASNSHFSDAKAAQLLESAARSTFATTTGQPGSTQVLVAGTPATFDQMQRLDFRFLPGVESAVTSIDTAFSRGEKTNVWVASWERDGVFNPHTGLNDGTAYVVVVMEDGTGRVLSSSSGGRQPEVQAKARDPLPTFDEFMTAHPPPAAGGQ